jgi:predicted DsbA family dithiol-disulfide isomerase
MEARMHASFEASGLVFNPPADVVPNTRLAHRVTELARERGLGEAMHERLMDAYWDKAQNIGDPEVLRGLAAELGLDGVDAALTDEAYDRPLLGSTERAHSIGVTGVPAFLLDRRLLVLGAQPRAVFEQAFEQLRADE